jgi:hypothetical protein
MFEAGLTVTQDRIRAAPSAHPLLPHMTRSPSSAVLGAAVVLAIYGGPLGAQAGTQASASTPTATSASAPDISTADLRQRLSQFSDDSMLGRETGTIGNVKATDYIARAARQLGLRPAGENGTYFQTVAMINRSIDTTSTMIVNGGPVVFGRDWLPLASRGGQSPVRPSGSVTVSVAVYGGRLGDSTVMLTPEQSSGRIVVLDASLGAGGRPVATFRGALDHYPGAAAIALATLDLMTAPALQAARRPLLVLPRPEDARDPRPVGVSVTEAEAARLMGAPLAGLQPGATHQVAVDLTVRVTDAQPTAPARNVIAVFPGADLALRGEYVALGAHSDHLGVAAHGVDADSLRAWNAARWKLMDLGSGAAPTPGELATIHVNMDSLRRIRPAHRDSIFNGADDDGSGTVTLLEIAQAFTHSPVKPKRSILFVWHTGEEKGLLGSAYFTDHPTVSRDSIVSQLNLDMVGRGRADEWKGAGPRYLMLVGSRRLSTELGDMVERVNKTEPEPFVFDYTYDANGHPENVYCRSDHYEYARYGIPIVFFTTGLHQDYHQVTDEVQYIDFGHLARVDRLVFDVAMQVANLDHRPVVDKPKPDPHGVCKQ